MPKSKRHREVALTKTEKRSTRAHKSALFQQVRDAVDEHQSIYVFTYESMRSAKFKNVRLHFRDDSSRIFLGKNKLLQIALGRSLEEEYADNLRHVSKLIVGGSVGLLFTSRPSEDVAHYFGSMVELDFARAGCVANRDAIVTPKMLTNFPTSMMEPFRKLGMPVLIETGTIKLRDNLSTFRICKEGEILTAEKCKLLVHFGLKLANFQVTLAAQWSDGEYKLL